MDRRRKLFIGMIASAIVVGFFALFLSLWRVVPGWVIGCWSLRTLYIFTPASSLDELLRSYHHALGDHGYSRPLDPFLISRLRNPATVLDERDAILQFYSLRVPRSRASKELFSLGVEWIGPVLEATKGADLEVRCGAVFLMEGLYRGRELYKPVIYAEPQGPSVGLSRDNKFLRAYAEFYAWWSLSSERRGERSPLDDTGILIGEP